jgi:hypothetical protein
MQPSRAIAFGVRVLGIPLANSENGTVQGAVATWWTLMSLPTKRQVATAPCTVPIRQRYPKHPHSKGSAILYLNCAIPILGCLVAFDSQAP